MKPPMHSSSFSSRLVFQDPAALEGLEHFVAHVFVLSPQELANVVWAMAVLRGGNVPVVGAEMGGAVMACSVFDFLGGSTIKRRE